jgi:hypothetical protein
MIVFANETFEAILVALVRVSLATITLTTR